MAAVPLCEEVRVLSQMPSVVASWLMFAGVPLLPVSITMTSKEKVQPTPFAKFSGGPKVKTTLNGSAALTAAAWGSYPSRGCRCTGWRRHSGRESRVRSADPPVTLMQEGWKLTVVKTCSSGAPAFRLGPLVTVRLILTVCPITRLMLSAFGNQSRAASCRSSAPSRVSTSPRWRPRRTRR